MKTEEIALLLKLLNMNNIRLENKQTLEWRLFIALKNQVILFTVKLTVKVAQSYVY